MEAEHTNRMNLIRWKRDIRDHSNTIADCEKMIATLKSELNHGRDVRRAQRNIIDQLQDVMSQNGIHIKQKSLSMLNCKATNHEVCPLSLAPINESPLPLSNDEQPCTLVLNPLKPEYKCAELPCGHRFNSMWLLYHFVENKTFQCPVCRDGQKDSNFQLDTLPPGVLRMLENVRALKR